MSIFGTIMSKIFHHGQPVATPAPQAAPTTAPVAAAPTAPAPAAPAPVPAPAPATATPIDVEAVLIQIAASKGGASNWRTSIVDLLQLLELDSSLASRKQLANELNIHVGNHGTAEENIALRKAVMQKLADNGGKVPDSLKG